MNRGLACVFAVVGCLLASCEEELLCTAKGCGHGVLLRLQTPDDEVSTEHLITLEISWSSGEASTIRCTALLPAGTGDPTPEVLPFAPYAPCSRVLAYDVDGAAVRYEDGVFTLAREDPATFLLTVEREGVVRFSGPIAPDYEVYYPNGEQCDASHPCHQAEVDVVVASTPELSRVVQRPHGVN